MQIERQNLNAFVVKELPDGSKIVMNPSMDTVFALNATAGAAWDACSERLTIHEVTEQMQRRYHPEVTEELAQLAIHHLRENRLVTTSEVPVISTRREMIAALGAVAIPLVVSLSVTEQRAYAQKATSASKPKACAAC